MGKPVWRNDIEREAWIEKNCRVCCHPEEVLSRLSNSEEHGCPHLLRAQEGKLPTPWKRRRNAVLGETYKCDAFTERAPSNRRKSAPADTGTLFDNLEPDDRHLVPVDGWPDWRSQQRKSKEGEHQ